MTIRSNDQQTQSQHSYIHRECQGTAFAILAMFIFHAFLGRNGILQTSLKFESMRKTSVFYFPTFNSISSH